MRPTLKDVCREALVSEATVSRVINNSPLVHGRTRERVLDVIRKLGYTPNAAGRNLSRSKTDVIGAIFHQMSTGFFAQVMGGIDKVARDRGYHILCSFTHFETEPGSTCARMFDEMRVDGMIILDPGMGQPLIEQLKKYRRPIVMVQRELADPEIGSVAVDNRGGAYKAVKHLLALGYRDLLVVRGPAGAQDAQLRLEGCRQALAEAPHPGMKCHYIDGHYSPVDALNAFRDYWKEYGLPRAVFALNDAMALAILKELRATGVKVPEDVAIVGFDGIDSADFVGLTTIETPMAAMGESAVQRLLERFESPAVPAGHVILETKLVVRSTCGGAATA